MTSSLDAVFSLEFFQAGSTHLAILISTEACELFEQPTKVECQLNQKGTKSVSVKPTTKTTSKS